MLPLLAGLAALVLLILLLRGFAGSDPKSLARVLRLIGAAGCVLLAVGLALTGRIAFALLAAGAAWALYTGGRIPWPWTGMAARTQTRSSAMSRAEALKVLGLDEGAMEDDIRAAHRRLILQNHPDKGGSSYLAAKINEARRVLLGE